MAYENVTRDMKEINGKLFDQAFSPDPAIACQAIGKLVMHLRVTFKVADVHIYDKMLEQEAVGANRAWYEYTAEKNPGRAMQTVRAVLFKIGEFAHNKDITALQPDAFVGGK